MAFLLKGKYLEHPGYPGVPNFSEVTFTRTYTYYVHFGIMHTCKNILGILGTTTINFNPIISHHVSYIELLDYCNSYYVNTICQLVQWLINPLVMPQDVG